MNWPLHGANPQYIYQMMRIDMPKTINDFSANINALGPPLSITKNWPEWLPVITKYPDPNGEGLKKLISERENIPVQSILLGNGGAELIQLIAYHFREKRVLIIQPTFSEYEQMCRAFHCDISYFQLEEGTWEIPMDRLKETIKNYDLVFLCHPNNPTGIVYDENELVEIIKCCQENNCNILIDEAFYDFMCRPLSMVSHIKEFDCLMILRSMTKMYAIAGLRLGYLLANESIVRQLKQTQVHWSVNGIALLAGEASIEAEEHPIKTRKFYLKERHRIIPYLRNLGYIISNSEVNYYLLRDPQLKESFALFEHLVKKGIVPRHTANYPSLDGRWLRFAIKNEVENNLLLEALAKWKTIK